MDKGHQILLMLLFLSWRSPSKLSITFNTFSVTSLIFFPNFTSLFSLNSKSSNLYFSSSPMLRNFIRSWSLERRSSNLPLVFKVIIWLKTSMLYMSELTLITFFVNSSNVSTNDFNVPISLNSKFYTSFRCSLDRFCKVSGSHLFEFLFSSYAFPSLTNRLRNVLNKGGGTWEEGHCGG